MRRKRMLARKKRRLIRKAKYYGAWALVYSFEVLMAAAPTALVAAFLIPCMEAKRGYSGYGGEWILLGMIFLGVFWRVSDLVLLKIYGEED